MIVSNMQDTTLPYPPQAPHMSKKQGGITKISSLPKGMQGGSRSTNAQKSGGSRPLTRPGTPESIVVHVRLYSFFYDAYIQC